MYCLSSWGEFTKLSFAVVGILIFLTACNAKSRKESSPTNLACPSQLNAASVLNSKSVKYGLVTPTDKILMEVGLVNGLPRDSIDPVFSDEHIDEWDVTSEGDVAIWEYDAGRHPDMWLRCDYFPRDKYDGRGGGYQKADGRVTLLMPIPDSASFKCTFIRNPEELKFSANCTLK